MSNFDSFTQNVKQELLGVEYPIEHQEIVLSTIIKSLGKIRTQQGRDILEIKSSFSDLIKIATNIVDWVFLDCQYQINSTTRRNFSIEREVFSLKVYNELENILSFTKLCVDDKQINYKNLKKQQDRELNFLMIRYFFICLGSVNSPIREKQYHLELRIKDELVQKFIIDVCKDYNINFKVTNRKSGKALYLNKSEEIGDFLNLIGCQDTLFQFEDERIGRDLYLVNNRYNNADVANTYKTISASQKQIDAIKQLKKDGRFDSLSTKARIVAKLREQYPQMSLSELAEINENNLTKSNISYHLKNIVKQASGQD